MSKITAANLVNEPLTTQESKQLTLGPAISTVTFLRGDITAATATLKSRLAILLKANPYLAGTLVKINGALHVQFPKETSDDDVTRIFNQTTRGGKVGTLPIVDSTMDFFTLCKSIGGGTAEVVKGARKDEPLMALTVVADAKRNDTFAVVFSISHVIIDGFSYYKLFSQLCDGVASESYSATRKHDIVSEAKKAMGEKEAAFVNSTAVICNVIGGMMCGKKPLIESYRIDADKVNTIKQQATNNTLGVDFVSTNDVLTSSFGNATNADFLLMPVNFRDRLSNFNALDAGNYEGTVWLVGSMFGCLDCISNFVFYPFVSSFFFFFFFFHCDKQQQKRCTCLWQRRLSTSNTNSCHVECGATHQSQLFAWWCEKSKAFAGLFGCLLWANDDVDQLVFSVLGRIEIGRMRTIVAFAIDRREFSAF